MKIKPLSLAGAVAMALGGGTLAFAQAPSNMPPPPTTATSPTMATAAMSSPTMRTSSRAARMGTSMMGAHRTGMHGNMNMSTSEIKSVQKALRGMGYYVSVDGKWGQATSQALKSLQFKNGLKVTGHPNADTMRALGLKGNQGPATTHNGRTQSSSGTMNRGNDMSSQNRQGMTGARSAETMNNGMNNGMNNNMHNNMNGMHHRLSKQQMMKVQRALNQHGYQVPMNGQWNQQSRQALMKFQRSNGLNATGMPNEKTMQALGLTMHNPSQGNMSSSGMSGNQAGTMNNGMNNNMNMNEGNNMHRSGASLSKEQIRHLQMKLSRQGYQVDQTGKWDSQTRTGIMRFQRKNGLTQTGMPDMQTIKALGFTTSQWQSWGNSKTMSPGMATG